MKKTLLACLVGFIGVVFTILWKIKQRSKQSAISVPNQTVIQPVVTNPQPVLPSIDTPSLGLNLKEQRQNTIRVALDRCVALLLLVLPSCTLLLWSVSLVDSYSSSLPFPPSFENALAIPVLSIPGASTTVSTLPIGNSVSKEAHATLTIFINQLKSITMSEADFTGTFDLYMPEDLQTHICDLSRFDSPLRGCSLVAQPEGDCDIPVLMQQYATQPVVLFLNNGLGFVGSSTTIPLKNLFPSPELSLPCAAAVNDVHVHGPITLPLRSQGQIYPNDWYWGNTAISLALPSPLVLNTSRGFDIYLPLDLQIVASDGIGNMTMSLQQETRPFFPDARTLSILATRSNSFLLLVYLTALFVPLALLIFFFHALFSPTQREGEPLYNILLNVLIAAITVIAIRQVLVPSDLQGILTRLDLILITEGMAIWATLFASYALRIFRSHKTHARELS
jgi:hypothetical protein